MSQSGPLVSRGWIWIAWAPRNWQLSGTPGFVWSVLCSLKTYQVTSSLLIYPMGLIRWLWSLWDSISSPHFKLSLKSGKKMQNASKIGEFPLGFSKYPLTRPSDRTKESSLLGKSSLVWLYNCLRKVINLFSYWFDFQDLRVHSSNLEHIHCFQNLKWILNWIAFSWILLLGAVWKGTKRQ